MKKWGLIVGVLIIAAIVAVSGCTSNDNFNQSSNSSSSPSSGASGEKLQILNHKMTAGSYGTYEVKATITPNKDIKLYGYGCNSL